MSKKRLRHILIKLTNSLSLISGMRGGNLDKLASSVPYISPVVKETAIRQIPLETCLHPE